VTLKSVIVHVLVILMAAPSAMAQQRYEPADVWRAFADKLESGAFVSVRLKNGTKVKGHFIQVAGDVLRVRPKTRIPIAIRNVDFDDIESIDRQAEGLSPGAKVLVGIGIGAAAIVGGVLILIATLDD
jgi:hypothetical protein